MNYLTHAQTRCFASDKIAKMVIMKEVIDWDGDLWLLLPGGEILVSSKVLILATEYFKKMFYSGFLEGQTTLNDPKFPARLKMDEEDYKAIYAILKIAHHQYKELSSENMDLKTFATYCVVADKYMFVESLQPILSNFLALRLLQGIRNVEEAYSVLTASCLLRDGKAFRIATTWMVQRHQQYNSYEKREEVPGFENLPTQTCGKFSSNHERANVPTDLPRPAGEPNIIQLR